MPLREGSLNILWPLLAVLIAISLWFGVRAGGDNLLKNNTARSGIGSLERAGSVEQAEWIIKSWKHPAPDWGSDTNDKKDRRFSDFFSNEGKMLTDVASRSLLFDLFFIGFYASAMAVACLLAATEIAVRSRKPKPRLVALGLELAVLQLVTAGFDLIENFALWRMLIEVTNPWPWISYVCSIAKFTLLAISLFYIFIAFGFWVVDHRRPPSRNRIPATT